MSLSEGQIRRFRARWAELKLATTDNWKEPLMENPIMQFFTYKHLPEHLAEVSKPFCELAIFMDARFPRSAELSAGLRKLLEAKDCAVRARLMTDQVEWDQQKKKCCGRDHDADGNYDIHPEVPQEKLDWLGQRYDGFADLTLEAQKSLSKNFIWPLEKSVYDQVMVVQYYDGQLIAEWTMLEWIGELSLLRPKYPGDDTQELEARFEKMGIRKTSFYEGSSSLTAPLSRSSKDALSGIQRSQEPPIERVCPKGFSPGKPPELCEYCGWPIGHPNHQKPD